MKKLASVLLTFLLLSACVQHVTAPITYAYNLFTLDFTASNEMAADDSVNNHIASLKFTNIGRPGNSNAGQYLGESFFHEWQPAKIKYAFKFTYVPDVPLIGASTGGSSDSLGNWYRYTVNPDLIGKLIFEVHDTIGRKLSYKLYLDSYASIQLWYKGDVATAEGLAAAFNHHLLNMRKNS